VQSIDVAKGMFRACMVIKIMPLPCLLAGYGHPPKRLSGIVICRHAPETYLWASIRNLIANNLQGAEMMRCEICAAS
jgi:hypothetical protein